MYYFLQVVSPPNFSCFVEGVFSLQKKSRVHIFVNLALKEEIHPCLN